MTLHAATLATIAMVPQEIRHFAMANAETTTSGSRASAPVAPASTHDQPARVTTVQAPAGSYVAGLFRKGQPQICRKIGEEAAEVITAALGGEGDPRVVSEIADLWFHTMVLLSARGIPLRRVLAELAARHAKGT